ncbi:MAG: transglutaminase-like domain-containing protein, partial [Kangiellaceae bacterium]|nr:transglutaminase-like domain-containing protein [Kangiellaceae bacterium]
MLASERNLNFSSPNQEQSLLESTYILDFGQPDIQALISQRGWRKLRVYEQVGAVYHFVKDEILFGYNRRDDIPASEVLSDGYGQCNTKGTLFMALLRAIGIPCRFHGFTIEQSLQIGAIPNIFIKLAPKYIIHSWVEIYFDNRWINLEGFILDKKYLAAIQQKFSNNTGEFCGYGIATKCLAKPEVDWSGKDTFIQREGIYDDFGVFDS